MRKSREFQVSGTIQENFKSYRFGNIENLKADKATQLNRIQTATKPKLTQQDNRIKALYANNAHICAKSDTDFDKEIELELRPMNVHIYSAIEEMMKVRALKCIECFVLSYEPPYQKFRSLVFKSRDNQQMCKLAKGIHKLKDCSTSMEEGLRWTENNLRGDLPSNPPLLRDTLLHSYNKASRAIENAYYDFCEESPSNYPEFRAMPIPERLVELKSVVKKKAEEFYADMKEVSIIFIIYLLIIAEPTVV